MLIKGFFFQAIFLGLYVGGLYFDLGNKDYTVTSNWYSIAGFFFFINISFLMAFLSPVALIFPKERQIFLKQEHSRLYGVLPYFLSRSIVEIPYIILMPILFVNIFYWMIGLSGTAEQYFIFYLISILIGISGNSLGMLLGSLITD